MSSEKRDVPKHIKELMKEDIELLEKHCEGENPLRVLGTGISSDLDYHLGGFRKGSLIALCGTRYVGCSAMAVQIVCHAAIHEKLPVLFFGVESAALHLARKMMFAQAEAPAWKFRKEGLSDDDWEKVAKANKALAKADIFISDVPALEVRELGERVKLFEKELFGQNKNLGLVVIDRLHSRGRAAFRDARILKKLAKELDTPIIALWELKLDQPGRKEMEPELNDLTGKRTLGFPVDMVLMLYRDEIYHACSPDRGIARVCIHKNNNGRTGMSALCYDAEKSRFSEIGAGDGQPLAACKRVLQDRMFVACGEWDGITDRIREIIHRDFPNGFTMEELFGKADFDAMEQDIVGSVEEQGYLAAWMNGVFLWHREDKWVFVDLDLVGGLFGTPIEQTARILFDREDGKECCWTAFAELVAHDHETLYCWGDGAIASKNWLVHVHDAAGILGFKFSIEKGRHGTRPAHNWEHLLDIRKHQPGQLSVGEQPRSLGGESGVICIQPGNVSIRKDLLARLLSVFGANLDALGEVQVLIRGPRDPVVLVVGGEPRAALMPES